MSWAEGQQSWGFWEAAAFTLAGKSSVYLGPSEKVFFFLPVFRPLQEHLSSGVTSWEISLLP